MLHCAGSGRQVDFEVMLKFCRHAHISFRLLSSNYRLHGLPITATAPTSPSGQDFDVFSVHCLIGRL